MRKVWMMLLILTAAHYVHAQSIKKVKPPKEYVYPSNIIKLNTTSLLFKTFAVQYERKLSSHWAFAPGIIYRPMSGVVLYKAISENGGQGITQDAQYSYGTMKLSRLCLTTDFKYYLKKRAPRGLYLSPFFRYRRDKNTFDYRYYESDISTSTVKIGKAHLTERSLGFGVLFGLQILSKNKLAIDFWAAGPWFGNRKSTIQSDVNVGNLNQMDKNSIASDLEEMSGVPVKFDNTGVQHSIINYGGGVRLIGVNIGYNF